MKIKKLVLVPLIVILAMTIIGWSWPSIAGISAFGESLTRSFKGVNATMRTFTQAGILVDNINGRSFRVSRDKRFDTEDSEGNSKNDSSVLLISLGGSHIDHVGSSMILAQTGLKEVKLDSGLKVRLKNSDPGTPWLNDLVEYGRNQIKGKGKIILVRSQDGTPIAVYAGNAVEPIGTDIPKSTWFRVDGKYLFVYRCDYTVYDKELLLK